MTVICLQCQTTNTPKSRFCRSCGAPVTVSEDHGQTTIPMENDAQGQGTTQPLESEPAGAAHEHVPAAPAVETPITSLSARAVNVAETVPEAEAGGLPQAIAAEVRAEMAHVDPRSLLPSIVTNNEDIPLRVACNFNRIFIETCNSTFQIRVENLSHLALDTVILRLECGGWEKPVERRVNRLAPGQRQVVTMGTMATRPGNFPLNCSVKGVASGQQLAYFGTTTVAVMTKPDANNMVINISNNMQNSKSGSNAGLGEDVKFGDFKVSDLVNKDAIRTINDLIQMALPEKFEVVELSLDYELSVVAAERFAAKDEQALSIPSQFIGYAQQGSMLKFTPISSPAGAAPLRPLHLSARRLYKFGRKREEVDYPAWFWPRSQENDDKTRRISHWHCSLEWREDGLWVVDNHAPNYTSFDQDQVTEEKPVSFSRRGVLGLAGSYFIDAMPFEASHPNGPPIANIRLWAGPAETPRRLPQGCVRFSPMSSEVAFYDVVWLLSDGTFGTSRTNPIVVEAPGLAEIQGRFYHWRGCFWMENTLGNRSVRVNSIELRSNEIVPLVSGQTIDLGQASYRVEVIR